MPILLVSNAQDDSLREAVEQLRGAGARVEIAPDVYAAMARLAQGDRFDRVAVDVRTLDRAESAFLQLVPRYCADVRIEVPWLDGTTRAVVQLGQPELQTSEIAEMVESICRQAALGTMDRPSESPAVAAPPVPNLSTDGLADEAAAEPSLHEAVRLRMAEGDESPPLRRRPPGAPGRTPPSEAMTPATMNNLQQRQDDVDIPLGPSDQEDGNGGTPQ